MSVLQPESHPWPFRLHGILRNADPRMPEMEVVALHIIPLPP